SALYRQAPGGMLRLTPYRVCSPGDLASDLLARHEDVLAVGDGAVRYADVLHAVDHVEVGGRSEAHPRAETLVDLAQPRALREEFVSPSAIEPLYLRKADAEANFA